MSEYWDHDYRRLEEGEIIKLTDDYQLDDGSWITVAANGGLTAGKPAPNPSYTSHRVYRRRKEKANG